MKSPSPLEVYQQICLPLIREASAATILVCQDLHIYNYKARPARDKKQLISELSLLLSDD
jgi:hypothetical protein